METLLTNDIAVAAAMGLIGAVVFAAIGLVSGTDETTTLAPLTLLVVLLGVPPAGVFTFFLAGAVAKHMTHAVPTALLGIPGDTLATPLLQDANMLRKLGVPHIALRKMVSGGIVAAFVAVPLAVLFAVMLAPFGSMITKTAPWIFLAAALLIAYFSAGRWASVMLLIPFVVVIIALQSLTAKYEVKLSISYFLGIAIGPLIADLFTVISPAGRQRMLRDKLRQFNLAPDVKGWSGYFPNPLKVLDRVQTRWTLATATISSATFVFSPVAMTVVLGELVGSRIKHAYHRLTTVLSARNGVTEATYIAEALIPLIAFGLPLSPVAAGPAAVQRAAALHRRCRHGPGEQPAQPAQPLGVPGLRHAGRGAGGPRVLPLRHELRAQRGAVRLAPGQPRGHHRHLRGPDHRHQRLGRPVAGPARDPDHGPARRPAVARLRLQHRRAVHGLLHGRAERAGAGEAVLISVVALSVFPVISWGLPMALYFFA